MKPVTIIWGSPDGVWAAIHGDESPPGVPRTGTSSWGGGNPPHHLRISDPQQFRDLTRGLALARFQVTPWHYLLNTIEHGPVAWGYSTTPAGDCGACFVKVRDLPGYVMTSSGPMPLVTTQPGYNAVVDLYQARPAAKRVEDWPCRCPKCGRDKAAVLLFSFWDCRFGCYSTKAVAK